jgi:hypothetical protein
LNKEGDSKGPLSTAIRNRSTRRVQDAEKQTNPHRPNENATHRARLDNADTSAAFDASGRRAKEDAATEKATNKDGSNPRRKSENNAAEFPAKAAGSPQGLSTTLPTIIETLRESKRLVSGVQLLIELAKERQARAPSIGVGLYRPRWIFSSDAWNAVRGRLSPRNGLLELRICSARDRRVECSLDCLSLGL